MAEDGYMTENGKRAENSIENAARYTTRDYSRPIVLNLHGIEGLRTYLKIITTPAKKYDAAKAKEIAAENLRRQGLDV